MEQQPELRPGPAWHVREILPAGRGERQTLRSHVPEGAASNMLVVYGILRAGASVLAGVYGADDVHIGSINGTYLTKDVGTNKAIGTGTVVLSGGQTAPAGPFGGLG